MGWFVDKILKQAKLSPQRIAFPEYKEDRVVKAAEIIAKEGIAYPLILSPDKIERKKLKQLAEVYLKLNPKKCKSLDEAEEVVSDPLYYGAMLTRLGEVDGFVAGAGLSTSSVIRAALRCLEIDEEYGLISGCFVMELPDESYGERGVLIYNDCAVTPSPAASQLAIIGLEAARFAREILEIEPRVAFLSFSTKGSASTFEVEKVKEAVALLKEKDSSLLVDGEFQVDAAIEAEVARRKAPNSDVAGKANVFIFPNLDAGNISYKLTERLAKAEALGPILLGFKQICSDLSRGVSVKDIVNITALNVVRIQKSRLKRT